MKIRSASPVDAAIVGALLADYLRESFPGHLGTSAEVLERDVLSGASGVRVLLAESAGEAVGFTTWNRVYDIHWGKGGAEVGDLYVSQAHRGTGVALALVAAICGAAAEEGLTYLRGGSFDRASAVGRVYEHVAVAMDSAECHCSGRAFRHLASLDGQAPREILRQLPPKEWNFEP